LAYKVKTLQENTNSDEDRYVSQLCYLVDKLLNEVPHLSRIVVVCCLGLNS
jgi:hypothetical protein